MPSRILPYKSLNLSELIITLSNASTSNNYKEGYKQRSASILYPPYKDTMYRFQDIRFSILLIPAITANQLNDPTVARLVAE